MNIHVPRWLHWTISVVLVLGMALVIVWKWQELDNQDGFWSTMCSEQLAVEWKYLIACLFLAPVNWFLEVFKWKVLHPESTWEKSTLTIFHGWTWALMTPLGLGDYLGRSYYNKEHTVRKSMMSTLLTGISQNLANFFWAVVIVGLTMPVWINDAWNPRLQIFGVLVLLGILTYLFFPRSLFGIDLSGKKIRRILLLLSVFRAAVYIMQYVLILWFWSSDGSISGLASVVSIVFLIQSGIPMPELLGVAFRAELAILIFSYEGVSELLALVSALSIWTVNRLGPALLGYVAFLLMSKDESTIKL